MTNIHLRATGTVALLSLCAAALLPANPAEGVREPQELDARTLFLAHCAQCHGEKGDGKGSTPLDRPARSFLDGGFSYGNTGVAIRRSVTHGIPGTPMPGFGQTLSAEQIGALAQFVIALGPERRESRPEDRVWVVSDRPAVLRGSLPPITDGVPATPRGLLIGLTTGTTFEYAVDNVRLLGVRQGDFVSRDDWQGRGGTPVMPLGRVTFLNHGGQPAPSFSVERDEEEMTLYARLKGTRIDGEEVVLSYALLSLDLELGRVHERMASIGTSLGGGFTRSLKLVPTDGTEGLLYMDLMSLPDPLPVHAKVRAGKSGWIVVNPRPDGLTDYVRIEPLTGISLRGGRIATNLSNPAQDVRVTILLLEDWNSEVEVTLEKDLAR